MSNEEVNDDLALPRFAKFKPSDKVPNRIKMRDPQRQTFKAMENKVPDKKKPIKRRRRKA